MKKIALLALLAMLFSGVGYAQNFPTELFDVATKSPELTKSIGKIVGGFTKMEESSVSKAVSSFLTGYNKIQPLLKANPTEFKAKFSEIKKSFDSSMKLGLAAAKLAKFSGNGSPTDALLKLL